MPSTTKPRAVVDVLADGTFRIFVSGVGTSGSLMQDMADVSNMAYFLNNFGTTNTKSPTLNAIIGFLYDNKAAPSNVFAYGHSLGTEEVAALVQLGWVRAGFAFAPPYFLSAQALTSPPWATLYKYSGNNDLISNDLLFSTNDYRAGVLDHFYTGDTGNNTLTNPFNAHNRDTYFSTFGLGPW